MYNKEEAKHIREEFWTNFGKSTSRKWILYDTKIKEIQLKFSFNQNAAQVSIDIATNDDVIRAYYFEKLVALKTILKENFLPDIQFEENYVLPEEKTVSRIYTELKGVSIYNKEHWQEVFDFFNRNMSVLEEFFFEFEDYLKD